MEQLAKAATSPGDVFFTGGVTMLLLGIREQTIDIDLKLDPEPGGVFQAIAALKDKLDINVELAAPDHFIPTPENWRTQSIAIDQIERVRFFHYDLCSQALAKIERGHDQDLDDVTALIQRGHVSSDQIRQTFAAVKSRIIRYPALDQREFEQKIEEFLSRITSHE